MKAFFKWAGIGCFGLFVMLAGGFAVFYNHWSSGGVSDCSVADPVRVIVGGIEFHIPAALNPKLSITLQQQRSEPSNQFESLFRSAKSKKGTQLERWYCQKPDEPAFEIISFGFRGYHFQRAIEVAADGEFQLAELKRLADLENIDRFTIAGSGDVDYARQVFCDGRIDKSEEFYFPSTFARNKQFHMGELNPLSVPRFYISKKRILFNTPLSIWCIAMLPADDGTPRRSCVFDQPVSNRIIVTGRFVDDELQPETWDTAAGSMEGLIRSVALHKQQIIPLDIPYKFNEKGLTCLPERSN